MQKAKSMNRLHLPGLFFMNNLQTSQWEGLPPAAAGVRNGCRFNKAVAAPVKDVQHKCRMATYFMFGW